MKYNQFPCKSTKIDAISNKNIYIYARKRSPPITIIALHHAHLPPDFNGNPAENWLKFIGLIFSLQWCWWIDNWLITTQPVADEKQCTITSNIEWEIFFALNFTFLALVSQIVSIHRRHSNNELKRKIFVFPKNWSENSCETVAVTGALDCIHADAIDSNSTCEFLMKCCLATIAAGVYVVNKSPNCNLFCLFYWLRLLVNSNQN